ncbi:GNAT family N-acetyltransferase [Bacillota bacterium LCP21S3_A4]
MKILILGGGFQQLPAIRKAHELGLTVLLADYLPDAPGRREADQSFLISTRDKDRILDLARKENVDGILAFASDPAEETAAYVAEKMGLPGGMYAAAGILGNKRKFREFLAMHRIPAPRHFPMDYPEGDLPYPVVVKPLDSSGSKGVTILRSYDAGRLLRAYQTAFSCSLSGQAMAEEYIPYGYRHLIGGDVIVRGGNVVLYGLMDCIREEGKNLVPCGKIYPCGAGDEVKVRIARIMQKVIHKLSITDAEMNVEFIAGKDGEVYPIEIALRCGGNGIPQLLSDATGIDWIREEVQRTLRCANGSNVNSLEECQEEFLEQTAGQEDDTDSVAAGKFIPAVPHGIYATYNLHANQPGMYAGYELNPELFGHLYREDIFRRKGEAVGAYENASGIIGILYFRFASRAEAEMYLYDMSWYLQVHVMNLKPVSSGTDILADIVRLGEFMTPPFSARSRCGQEQTISEKRNVPKPAWNTNAYAEKLMRLADIVTIENEKGEIIGLVAAYLNRSDFGFISMLIVMPEYRRCRAAEALCEKVHMLAREKNIPSIRGEIRKENMACRRLAEMLGYMEYKDIGNGFVGVEKSILY